MTDQELRDLVANLAVQHAGLTESQKETDRLVKELGRQIGGLGNKFGSFTEGMAYPAMKKILIERFGMEGIAPEVLKRQNNQTLELDVFAWSNARHEAFVVEVKSHLREEALEQLDTILRKFHAFYPEHRDKKVYGILAAVHASEEMEAKVLQEGFYLARIHDGQFELRVPDGFQPRAF